LIPPLPVLLSVAGLGVSLAGFSGLVAAFRRGATWQKVDSYRLRQIPEMGLAASLLALLMIPLADTAHDAPAAIRIAALAALAFSIFHMVTLIRRVRRMEIRLSRPRWIAVSIIDLAVLASGVVAALAPSLATFEWLLVVMLARPMLAFVFVLADVAEG
jgi:hypothetical protein